VTIEREKIRHRRPDDMRVYRVHDEPPSSGFAPPPQEEEDDSVVWANQEEWQEPEGAPADEGQAWDSGADDEWVFDQASAADPYPQEPPLRDDGIVWEDSDDIDISPSPPQQGFDDVDRFAPEVELAGRRDVRPRPPRPGTTRAAPRSYRQPVDDFDEDDALSPMQPQPSPAGRRAPQERPHGRFARTRAALDTVPAAGRAMPPADAGGRTSTARRRQPQPPTTPYAKVAPPVRRRSPLMIVMLIVLATGGAGLAYYGLGAVDFGGLVTEWGQKLGFGGAKRTAADTPFENSVPPEEAVADLSQSGENTGPDGIDVSSIEVFSSTSANDAGSQAGGPLNPDYDGTATLPNGIRLPQFKPRDSQSRSITGNSSIGATELDANGNPLPGAEGNAKRTADAGQEPSFFERLLSYF
jgi:hypothetical protein